MASTGEPFGLFWNSENGDRTYDASSFEYWLKKFFTSGVFEGDLQVQATSGMTLKVGPGYANVDGKVRFWNAEFNLILSPANSTYPRIDTVVITRDNVNRNITCEVVTGAYSGDTPQPTTPVRTAEIYQLVLAQIYVGNGVTEITQADITDTRQNTELCGYIVGTVTEMDFSQFVAQFESYFAQFKSQHEHEWSVWEQTQVAAYAAWFANVQAQQIEDKADWDQWYADLQEELHMLPPDSAEYLQIQIDEIRESGTTGSIFHITTTNTELEGKTVTVSCGSEVRTATFDENLECSVVGFKSVGAVTITSTDGIQTATRTLNIDYYSKYEIPIAFWSATVNIQGDDNLKGATITVKDSDDLTVDTVVLNVITGRGVFSAQKADTYTFNYTFSGTDYSESLVVDEETTYSLSLSAGFNWRGWVDTAQFLDSTDYNSLDEVLADEEAVRELCLEHACVDYLARVASVTADVETIIENDLFAKWVNNSDYSLDVLGANVAIKALMDEADKYFYGEWVITDDTTTPPTWGAKGNVPVMTSNNAPYGEVSATTAGSSNPAYKAFDGDTTNGWIATSPSNQRLIYKFTNPVCPKMAHLLPRATNDSNNCRVKNFKIQGSNDGSTWVDLFTGLHTLNATGDDCDLSENTNYYLYLACLVVDTYQNTTNYPAGINILQFYGRELSVSVPAMTSNTVPYGEAIIEKQYDVQAPWKAFDGDDINTYAETYNTINSDVGSIGYIFNDAVEIIELTMKTQSAYANHTFRVGYSDDGSSWEYLTSNDYITKTSLTAYDVEAVGKHKYWKVNFLNGVQQGSAGYYYMAIFTLQFYGFDYSEKEFEEGATKKWLYDHGVELEEMEVYANGSGNTATKGTQTIDLVETSAASATPYYYSEAITNQKIDLTNYNLLRAITKDNLIFNGLYLVVCSQKPYAGENGMIGYSSITANSVPYNNSLDISSYNNEYYVNIGIENAFNGKMSVDELWLE